MFKSLPLVLGMCLVGLVSEWVSGQEWLEQSSQSSVTDEFGWDSSQLGGRLPGDWLSQSAGEEWDVIAELPSGTAYWLDQTPMLSRMARRTLPRDRRWLWGDSVVDSTPRSEASWWQVAGRGFYLNDQRWEFTGQEATFGAEGILAGGTRREYSWFQLDVGAELYLNQPFDDNILVDTADRVAYRPHFLIDPLEISQLALSGDYGMLKLTLGKFVTPFGRTEFPVLSNSRWDAPFIRSEAILWRETGLLIELEPGRWDIAAAITNGSEDQDTNSSKAIVARVGYEAERWVVGGSVKHQDGIGSEGQKQYNNHVGIDATIRGRGWSWSSEIIHDEYGFRRGDFSADQITWGRSLYHRDLHLAFHQPLTGWGFYSGFLLERPSWLGWVSYGEFHPQAVGDPIHDETTRRFLGKWLAHLTPDLDAFVVLMLENSIEQGQADQPRHGTAVLSGFQASF